MKDSTKKLIIFILVLHGFILFNLDLFMELDGVLKGVYNIFVGLCVGLTTGNAFVEWFSSRDNSENDMVNRLDL